MITKTKVIHCRVTPEEHEAIVKAAKKEGLSLTKFVVRAVLAEAQAPAD